MAEVLRIDCHMHLYETKAAGRREKETYEIWEYGSKPGVFFSTFDGDVEDAEAAMARAGYDHAVIANLFAIALLEDHLRSATTAAPSTTRSQQSSTISAWPPRKNAMTRSVGSSTPGATPSADARAPITCDGSEI